jgi:hypothetical protein
VANNQPPGGFDDASTSLQRKLEEPGPATPPFVLVAIEGPINGQSFPVDASSPAPVLLGQSPVCEILHRRSTGVATHASIAVRGRSLRLVDHD